MDNMDNIENFLKKYGQDHLIQFYDELSFNQKEELIRQIKSIDISLLESVISLKKEHNLNINNIEQINVLKIEEINNNRHEFEVEGLKLINANKVGVVILAGGEGSRLGYNEPKALFNIGVTRKLYLVEILINNLLKVIKKSNTWIPLFFMTSVNNDNLLQKFLRENDYFGYNSDYIHFYIQEQNPCIDLNGKILLSDKFNLSLSPNGNGNWYFTLTEKIDKQIIDNIEWYNVVSIDNVLQNIADPVFIGATSIKKFGCGAKVVKKISPNENVGTICLNNNKPFVMEYYEITDDMRYKMDSNRNLIFNYGVTLNYLFKNDVLKNVSKSDLPFHYAKKNISHFNYKGEMTKNTCLNGYKIETLILDLITHFKECLPFEIERESEFSPLKNKDGNDSIETARRSLQKKGYEI
jgi:UDP-N-acetylglucosamine/UDP-N-acetylgalactosamine diphosphorylase